jgi:hypothetical protein
VQIGFDGEYRLPGLLCGRAGAGADGELKSLGEGGLVRAGAQGHPLLRRVEQAHARAVDPQHACTGPGQADGEQFGAGQLRLRRLVECEGEAARDGHTP